MNLGYRSAAGVQIRYAESAPAGDRTILLTSPWLESILCYQRVWDRLARYARLIAIDLPGFGQSERHPDLTGPRAMADFVLALIDEWDIDVPHIVAPDIGTAATLFAAARRREAMTSIVAAGAAAVVPLHLSGVLRSLVQTPGIVASRFIDSRALVTETISAMRTALPSDVRADYLSSYRGDRFLDAVRYVRAYSVDLPVLAELLPTITTPVCVVSASYDEFVPRDNGLFLRERIPNSRFVSVPSGHFVWEDAADDFAALVIEWVTTGYAHADEDEL